VEISDIGHHEMTHAGCNGSTYKADSPLDELARRLNLCRSHHAGEHGRQTVKNVPFSEEATPIVP
jgi:hypothetical protein